MMKPVAPARHCQLDYGFTAILTGGLVLLGLQGASRILPETVGVFAGSLNGLTDEPDVVRRLLPFQAHGVVDTGAIPAFLIAGLLADVWKDTEARPFLLGMGSLIVVNDLLTDWDARAEPGLGTHRLQPGEQKVPRAA